VKAGANPRRVRATPRAPTACVLASRPMVSVERARHLCIGLLLLALLARPGAAAQPSRPTRATVEQALRAHDLGPSEAAVGALGAGVDQVLIAIAGDAKAEALLRARAVSALAYCRTPAARKFLAQTISEKAAAAAPGERLLARKAAMALGWLGGPDVPALLAPLLDHTDPDVRIDAALALGLTRLDGAAELLRKRLPQESDARVRAQIGRQLRVIEASLVPAPAPKR
jgi:HEAT repeat protein